MGKTEVIDSFSINNGTIEYRLLRRNGRIIWQERYNDDRKPRFKNVLSFHGEEMPAYWNYKNETNRK